MNLENLRNKINSISNRTRIVIGLCFIAAGLLFGGWSFDLTGDQPDKEEEQSTTVTKKETQEEREAREAHEKFFNSNSLK